MHVTFLCLLVVASPSQMCLTHVRHIHLQVPLFPFIPALSTAINTFLLGQLVGWLVLAAVTHILSLSHMCHACICSFCKCTGRLKLLSLPPPTDLFPADLSAHLSAYLCLPVCLPCTGQGCL